MVIPYGTRAHRVGLKNAERYPVDDAGRMQVSDATQDLVKQVGHPLVVQVHVDHLTQAGIHQLHHQIPRKHRVIYLNPCILTAKQFIKRSKSTQCIKAA